MIPGPQGQLAMLDGGARSGFPILFLHADSGRASQWQPVMDIVGTSYRTIAFDFRGHGESAPATDQDYSYEGRAADVRTVADALTLEKVIVVAHSGAAAVALTFAAQNPDRVAGVLLVDPPTDPRALPPEIRDGFLRDLAGPNALQAQKAFYTALAGPAAEVRDEVLGDTEAVDPAARLGVARALASWNPEPTLAGYHGPLMVLASPANDTPAAIYRLRNTIPHRVIPEVGHWIQLDKPGVVADAVLDFAVQVTS